MSLQSRIGYSTVEAYERSKDRRATRAASHLFMTVLLAIFFVFLMGGLIAGVAMYSHTAQAQMDTAHTRVRTGLLTSYVKANDSVDVVGVGNGPEGKALVLAEELSSGIYEVRIYKYNGNIVQEYSVRGAAYTPARAQILMESDSFDFSMENNLLTISTDSGSVGVALRSSQSGA